MSPGRWPVDYNTERPHGVLMLEEFEQHTLNAAEHAQLWG